MKEGAQCSFEEINLVVSPINENVRYQVHMLLHYNARSFNEQGDQTGEWWTAEEVTLPN